MHNELCSILMAIYSPLNNDLYTDLNKYSIELTGQPLTDLIVTFCGCPTAPAILPDCITLLSDLNSPGAGISLMNELYELIELMEV